MSEYQYYEFLAVDRPLDEHQLGELRALSTRARITPTSLVNTYHWGDFRGDPRKLMERCSAPEDTSQADLARPTLTATG